MVRDTLAVLFQEPLTAVMRLRSDANSNTDANHFRQQIAQLILSCNEQALRQGFGSEDAKLAKFAVVALVDETILTLNQEAFANWRSRPLMQEMVGAHLAGEVFFQNLDQIQRRDSDSTADLLELYALCILLGFQGRYGGNPAELKSLTNTCIAKIRRIRGNWPALCPNGVLPSSDVVVTRADPWRKRLFIGAALCALLAILLFTVYKISLNSGAGELKSLAMGRKL